MIGKRIVRMLKPEDAWEAWAQTGSVYKAGLWLQREKGVVNTNTKRPFSHEAVWHSSTVYILNNLRDARKVFDEVARANGRSATDQDWYEFILPKVIRLPKQKYTEFMEKNLYIKPYMDEFNAKKQSQD